MNSVQQRDSQLLSGSRSKKTPIHLATQPNPLAHKAEATKVSFGQDFLLEHCSPIHQIAAMKTSGAPANPFKDLQESPQSYGFPC